MHLYLVLGVWNDTSDPDQGPPSFIVWDSEEGARKAYLEDGLQDDSDVTYYGRHGEVPVSDGDHEAANDWVVDLAQEHLFEPASWGEPFELPK